MLQCFPYNQNQGVATMQSSPNADRRKADSDYALAQSRKEKLSRDNNSRLLILGMQPPPSDEEALDEFEDSNQEIAPPPNRNLLSVDDYVEIPKITFSRSLLSPNPRKNQEVIKMEQSAVHALSSGNKQQGTEGNELQSLDSDRGEEWASWNLEKIKIIPHSNNFLDEEDMALPLTIDKSKSKEKWSNKLKVPEERKEKMTEERKEKVKERQIVKDRERRERERNIEMVSNFLSGKASVIWLFVLGLNIDERDLKNIRAVYADYIDNDYEVPLCRSYADAQRFLSLQTCFFKVVADLQSSEQLLEDSVLNKNIVAIYLYNPQAEAGITRTFELKRSTRKIKGMFMDLKQIADVARQEIENEAKFIRVGDELERDRNKLRFPSFVMLSGADSSQITAYRLCLYGALKIKEKRERQNYLKEFTDMVELRYAGVPKELQHLMDYQLINHTSDDSEQKLRDILKFYVKETFYYALTNSILRLSRSSEEFRPCTIPFNETYHAIRHYYKKYLQETNRSFKKFITYRGAKLRNSDVKSLSIGSYIQLLGFTSTSLKKSEAEKFMDNDSYLIEIHVDTGAKDDKQLAYDHGFVEINRYGIAAEAFQNEQQVLFNALNVFKVTAIDFASAVRKITLSYAGIFQLLRAKPNILSPTETAVLANYKYCIQTFESIEDDGDVLLLAHEHGKCIQYYQNRIDEGEKSYRTYGKLAFAQMENGNLDQAYENALKSLSLVDSEPQIVKQTQKYKNQIVSNAAVFEERQDYLHYETTMKRCVNSMQDNWLAQARLIKSRAERRMIAGDLSGCKQDLQLCRDIISQKQGSFEKRRKQIAKRYMFRSFCCCCSRTASQQLDEQRELELLKVEEDEVDYQHHQEEMNLLCVDIENLGKELAEQMGNKQLYEKSKLAAQQHYSLLTKKDAEKDPILQAKYEVLEAKVIKEESEIQFETRMESAIELIKEHDQFHKDIGTYSKILGTERHACIKKKLQLAPLPKLSNSGELKDNLSEGNYLQLQQSKATKPQVEKFDYFQHEKMYNKCKSSFSEAANNIAYNKGNDHSEFLQINNNIAELDYDYSFLQESEKTARKNSQRKMALSHTEGAKCYLLLAKIYLAKGELKNSFREVDQSYSVLRSALLKIDNKQYNQILMNNPLYMDINLQKVKIFNRQLKHDLALKQLKILKKIAKIKIDHQHHSSLLATILEEQANILVCLGQTDNFEKYVLKAIKIRAQEMGQFNIPNAISYANLFKYLIALNDFEEAMAYHFKATEIFSRFSPDHPNAWVIHMSNGIILEQKKEYDQAIAQLEYCLKVATQKYSSNHISLLKIQFHFAKMLKKLAKPDLALQVFSTLQAELARHIGSSPIQKETDDQKILLRRNLYREMKDLYGSNEQNMMTLMARQKCEKELKHYDDLFGSSELLDRNIK